MPGTVKEQIEAMLEAGDSTESPSTNAPLNTDPPSTGSPGTSAPTTYSPGTDAPSTDAPSTDAPATMAPTTAPPKEDDLSKALAEIEGLRQKVDDLTKKKEKPATAAPTTAPPVEEVDFLGESIDPRDMSREELNKILNKVYGLGVKATRKSQEDTLRSVPQIVKTNVVTQASLKAASEEFYDNNKDLQPFKKVVAAVFEEVASENPELKFHEVLEKVGPDVRKRLELHKKATTTEAPTTSAPKGPKFPKTKTSRQRQKPKTSGLLNEIDAMNKDQ